MDNIILEEERLKHRNLISKIKYNFQRIKFWGIISFQCVGELRVVNGRLDSKSYEDLVKAPLRRCKRKLGFNKILQDNDPIHKSRSTRNMIKELKLKTVENFSRIAQA